MSFTDWQGMGTGGGGGGGGQDPQQTRRRRIAAALRKMMGGIQNPMGVQGQGPVSGSPGMFGGGGGGGGVAGGGGAFSANPGMAGAMMGVPGSPGGPSFDYGIGKPRPSSLTPEELQAKLEARRQSMIGTPTGPRTMSSLSRGGVPISGLGTGMGTGGGGGMGVGPGGGVGMGGGLPTGPRTQLDVPTGPRTQLDVPPRPRQGGGGRGGGGGGGGGGGWRAAGMGDALMGYLNAIGSANGGGKVNPNMVFGPQAMGKGVDFEPGQVRAAVRGKPFNMPRRGGGRNA